MKVRKYRILTAFSLITVLGIIVSASGKKKLPPHKEIQRSCFLTGVLFTQQVMNEMRLNIKKELDDIQEIEVWIVELPQEAERYGLTRQALKTDTELRLRQHRIKVVTLEEHERRENEHLKQHFRYMKRLQDLVQAEDYEEAIKQTKEPMKSLLLSCLFDDPNSRFPESVAEYIKHSSTTSDDSPPTLHINVTPMILEKRRSVVASISIELRKSTVLRRGSSNVYTYAVLWERFSLISCGLHDLNKVRDEVRDYVDEFINDYLAANPKVCSPTSPATVKSPRKGLITAILYDVDDSIAMIAGQVVREGDYIDSIKIVRHQQE